MSILNINLVDLDFLLQSYRLWRGQPISKRLYLITFFMVMCGVGAAGTMMRALGRPDALPHIGGTTLSNREILRETLIEQLATARAELQEFALQVENTRARLRRLREAKAPTDLEMTRRLGAEAAWMTIRQAKHLQKRQDSLSRLAEKVFADWRREIRTVRNQAERHALVTHYKQVRRELNSLLKQQAQLITTAGASANDLTNVARELEQSSLSELNMSRQTSGDVDSGLLSASRQVLKSIASVDQFRKSARTIASLSQPR